MHDETPSVALVFFDFNHERWESSTTIEGQATPTRDRSEDLSCKIDEKPGTENCDGTCNSCSDWLTLNGSPGYEGSFQRDRACFCCRDQGYGSADGQILVGDVNDSVVIRSDEPLVALVLVKSLLIQVHDSMKLLKFFIGEPILRLDLFIGEINSQFPVFLA